MRLSTSKWNQYYCLLSLLIVCGNLQIVVSEITFVQRFGKRDIFGYVSSWNKCGNNARRSFGTPNSIECKCKTGYSTFLFSRKACVANSDTKGILFKNSDCSELLRLNNQYEEKTPYIVLDLQQPSQLNFNANQVNGIKGGNCKVDKNLYYIDDLTGKKMKVDAGNVFSIDTETYELEWQSLPPSISNLHGKVLGIVPTGCTFDTTVTPSVNKPCIILKAEGVVTFSTPVISPTATLHPIPSTQAVTSSSNQSIFVTTITPSRNVSPTAAKQGDKQSSPVGAIVGSVMAVIAIVVIIVVIVMWKRRKNTSGQNNTPQKGPNTPENPTYGNGSEIIDLSKQKQAAQTTVYTPLDQQQGNPSDQSTGYDKVERPVFKPARKGPTDPLYNVLERPNEGQLEPGTHDNPTGQSTGYDKVERPVFKPARKGPTDPLYNVLERPNEGQLEPGTHDNPTGQSTGYDKVERPVFKPPRKGPTDPLYNVLERPNGNNHDYMEPGVNIDKTPQNNEPVYNVLEGPGEDPDYNVLEDPNEQYEPEYNVLEGPGDKPDNIPVDGHDNVGYASTIDIKSGEAPNGPIYAAPEGPISEPTYQPLNVSGPDENVYQPLDRKSRVVPDDQPLYHVLESKTSDA